MAFFDNSYKRSDLAKQWWEQHVAAMNYRRTQETANFLPSLSPRSQALAPMGSPRAISSLTPRRRAGKLASVSPRSAYPPMADSGFFPQRTQKALGQAPAAAAPYVPNKMDLKKNAPQPIESAAMTLAAAPAGAPSSASPRGAKDKTSQLQSMTEEAIHGRFKTMMAAFKYIDLDNSGTVDAKEIERAMTMWNIPIENDDLKNLIARCDQNGDGQIGYEEFVDALARDTVVPEAMRKRDQQAMQAMGVHDLDPVFLGHAQKIKNIKFETMETRLAKQYEKAGAEMKD